jgi:hypothetical protein
MRLSATSLNTIAAVQTRIRILIYLLTQTGDNLITQDGNFICGSCHD